MSDLKNQIEKQVEEIFEDFPLDELTERKIRREIEKRLSLETNFLDGKLKPFVKGLVQKFLDIKSSDLVETRPAVENIEETSPKKVSSEKKVQTKDTQIKSSKKRNTQIIDDSDAEEIIEKEEKPKSKIHAKPKPKKAKIVEPSDSEDLNESENNSINDDNKVDAKDSDIEKDTNEDIILGDDSSEDSGVDDTDDEIAKIPVKKVKEAAKVVQVKPKVKSSLSEDSIFSGLYAKKYTTKLEQLRKYLVACGIRKPWTKEISNKSGPEAVEYLQGLLVDTGAGTHPTMAKCKEIKDKLALEKELESLDMSNVISEGRGRRTRNKNVSYRFEDTLADLESNSDSNSESDNNSSEKENDDDTDEDVHSDENSESESDGKSDIDIKKSKKSKSKSKTKNKIESDDESEATETDDNEDNYSGSDSE